MEQTHEHTPITGNLRQAMVQWGWADGREVTITDLQPSIDAEPFLTIRGGWFGKLCDAIDAIHAQLERENAELKAELDRVTGEQEERRHSIGEATVTITPRIDWMRMVDELDVFTQLVRGFAEQVGEDE